jgi:flagellar hook-basal body protein
MGLYGMMRTGVSGMNAQANKLSAVADNIANASTNGYKRGSTEFSSLVLPSTSGNYNSGSVLTQVRHNIGAQGGLTSTSSTTDLALDGKGFFVVQDASGMPYLTRAGSFVPDKNGDLVNVAGFTLMGYPYPFTGAGNGFDGMVPITLGQSSFPAEPTTNGTFTVNLPANGPDVGQAIINVPPSENSPYSAWNRKLTTASLNSAGEFVTTETYYTKIAENRWEVTIVETNGAPSTGFPYDLTSANVELRSAQLDFDPLTGDLIGSTPIVGDPNIDLSSFTQAIAGGSTPAVKINTNLSTLAPILDIAGGYLPASDNSTSSRPTERMSLRGYAGFPSNVGLDVYYTRTGPDTWEVAVYNAADATSTGAGAPFPYSSDTLGKTTLQFDLTTGTLISGGSLNVTLPGGETWPIDFSDSMSLADSSLMDNEGIFAALNLPATDPVIKPSVLGNTPADNMANSAYSHKTSLIAYDHLGRTVTLDVYFTKGADFNWEVAVFNRDDASPSGGFPYGALGSVPLATSLMRFDPQNGRLLEGGTLEIAIPNGETMTLDLAASTQLAADYQISAAELNGQAPSATVDTVIGEDGIVYDRSANGDMLARYQLAIANVASPDKMTVISGNVFSPSAESGDVTLGTAASNGNGKIRTGTLENSNVDIAQELTDMIEAQRSYTANSKVFQTGSELMDVLVNLKR